MPKYINADELIEKLEKEYRSEHYSDYLDGKNDMIDVVKILIDEMPAADVVEVKHGEWERIESDTSVHFRCSVCHRYRFHNGEMLRKYKFCPNCGAKMLPKLWI